MQTLVDDLRFMPLFRDDHSWEFRLPMNDETRAATAAFLDSRRLPANRFFEVEIPLTALQRRELTRTLSFPSCGPRRTWFCAGRAARRPRHRSHGARGRGVGGRQRARDGDDDGGGDADPDPSREARPPAQRWDLGLAGTGNRGEGCSDA